MAKRVRRSSREPLPRAAEAVAGAPRPRSKGAPGVAETAERAARRRRHAAAQSAARKLAVDAARLMSDDRCEDVLVPDLRGISTVCDFFVIATGTSERQMRAIADHIEALARARGERPYSTSGLEASSWMVLDYVDVVIHLFDAEHRRYYELETLWGDAPRVEWTA